MKRYGIVAAIAALVATIGLVVIGAPAHAADCRYDQWGSSPWKGQKYKCKDGSSLYIKPPYSQRMGRRAPELMGDMEGSGLQRQPL